TDVLSVESPKEIRIQLSSDSLLQPIYCSSISQSDASFSAGYIKDFGLEDFKNAIYSCDILLPNQEEFELLGSSLAQITVVKNGSSGVDVYAEGIKMQTYPVEKISAVDPTGAGDAFAGGLVATLANEEPLAKAIQVGIETAAKAVQTIGARPQL
ncbi:MAG: hypothetical protein EBZ87_01345, partial [Microbacteriaceae bacterium]|nr:hypothetical protein [Microbacteriaceae bacterium]